MSRSLLLSITLILTLTNVGMTQRHSQFDSLMVVLKSSGDKPAEEVVALRNKIGRLYKQRNLNAALSFAEETVLIGEKANLPPDKLTNTYAQVADLANLTGDFKKGALYADKSAKSLTEVADSLSLAKKFIVLMNKGGWVSPMVSPEEKIAYGLKALEIQTRLKNEGGIANASTELGNAYKNKAIYHSKGIAAEDSADFQKARDYFDIAARYQKKVNNIPQYAYCITLQGIMERQLGFPDKAYRLNKTAIGLYEQEGALMGAALPYSEISDIHFSKKRYDSALWYINRSIDLYEQVGFKGNIDEYYERRAKIYEAMHDYINALASTRRAKEERELKYKAENTRSIMELETKYENQLKEEQIKTLTADSRQNKLILWSTVLCFTSILAGLVLYLKQRQKTLKQYKEKAAIDAVLTQSLETQLKQVQMQALQAQMNPHFIYNALSSIQGLIMKEDKQNAITYLNDFAQLSRMTLEHSRKDKIKLKDELFFLRRYLELEALRHKNTFDYSIVVDDTIDPDFETVAPMIIQPIVENAINHGLAPKQAKGNLNIHFHISEEASELVCIVEDDGVGRRQAMAAKNQSHNSLSTDVNEARLKLINELQKLKDKYRIDIEDKFDSANVPAGTRVSVFLATSVKNEVARSH